MDVDPFLLRFDPQNGNARHTWGDATGVSREEPQQARVRGGGGAYLEEDPRDSFLMYAGVWANWEK